LTAWWC